jgi:hypothetical protein
MSNIRLSVLLLSAAALVFVQFGCKSSPAPTPRPESSSIRHEANTLDDYAGAVQTARTPTEEADAIRNLRQYEVNNGLTYQMQAVRVADNVPVKEPSASGQPVTVTVTIYRGRDVVKTFSFVPKDNRNLLLFGA